MRRWHRIGCITVSGVVVLMISYIATIQSASHKSILTIEKLGQDKIDEYRRELFDTKDANMKSDIHLRIIETELSLLRTNMSKLALTEGRIALGIFGLLFLYFVFSVGRLMEH